MKRDIMILMLLINIMLLTAINKDLRLEDNSQIIEFDNSSFTLDEAGKYAIINAPKANAYNNVGEPNLPSFMIQISTSKDYIPTVEVNILESQNIKLTKDIQPIPEIEKINGNYEYNYIINEAKYQNRTEQVQIVPNQNFRRVSFSEIHFNPFTYNYKTKSLTVVTKAQLIINIPDSNTSLINLDKLEKKFIATLANPKNIYLTPSYVSNINYTDFSIANHWYKIEIEEDGIYSLSYSNLQNILPVDDIDPRTIRIFTSGGKKLPEGELDDGSPFREIPILIEGEDDGSFNSYDRIIFYARDRNDYDYLKELSIKMSINPYSDTGIYWLTYDAILDEIPLRMETNNPVQPHTRLRTNNPQNSRYEREFYKRLPTNLYWYSNFLTGTSTSTYNYPINISDLDEMDNGINTFVKLALIQEYQTSSNPVRHEASISLNNITISEDNIWYGINYETIKTSAHSLAHSGNSIGITIHRNNQDNIYLDYIELQYMKKNNKHNGSQLGINFRNDDKGEYIKYSVEGSFPNNTRVYSTANIYEVENLSYSIENNKLYFVGKVPVSIHNESEYYVSKFYVTNNDYLSASITSINPVDVISEARNKESIIIYPEVFESQAMRLKSIYESTYDTATATIQLADIFNQFNGGMDDPTAIRNFLRHIYSLDESKNIQYVTLLGLGTYDWKNYKSNSQEKNKMIIYQTGNSSPGGGTTTDDYFVYLTQTNRPELAIGRYPAKTSSELDMMIDKFESYSLKEFTIDWWRNTGTLVADDFSNGTVTGETNHTVQLNEAGRNAPPSFINQRIYAFQYEPDEFGKKPTARKALIDAINEGSLLTIYSGHGSYDQLGSEAYFRQGIDTALLTNDDKRTFFVSAACDVSQFDSPDFDCLSSDLLKYDTGGAIATFGSTRVCFRGANNIMVGNLLYYTTDNREDIGTAIMLTKARQMSESVNQAKYVLFGDPHLEITPPLSRNNIAFDNEQVSFQARETVNFSGNLANNNIETSKVLAFQSDSSLPLAGEDILVPGTYIFNGESTITNGEYTSAFVVPDDITDGELGKILVYGFDNITKDEVLDYYYPVEFAGQSYVVDNESAPEISIWLESYDFRDADVVSKNPLLLVDISDVNGINVSGGSGHQLLLMIDDDFNSFDVTPFFNYDLDSYQSGKIEYQINDLTPGKHLLKILAFDNLNKPAVKTVNFTVADVAELSLSRVLPYPNPMPKNGGDFTFMISNNAEINIDIYTITGKKINTLKANVTKGFNKISWNGRDKHGDKIANNTYFYIIKASSEGKTVMVREKFIVLD